MQRRHCFDEAKPKGANGKLPRLGFCLWQLPAISIAVELALVLMIGAWTCWRTSRAVARERGRGVALAATVGALDLILDVAGAVG
jgi:hypothetical protein